MSPATDAAELESSDSLNGLGFVEVTVAPDVEATGTGMESWGGKGKGGAVALWRASEGIDLRGCSEGVPVPVAVGATCTCPCRERERPRGVGVVDISKSDTSILAPALLVSRSMLRRIILKFNIHSHSDWYGCDHGSNNLPFSRAPLLCSTLYALRPTSKRFAIFNKTMTNSLRRRQPSYANASIPQPQDPALKRFLLRFQTADLCGVIVSIAWLVAFIVLIGALAGVGYDGD